MSWTDGIGYRATVDDIAMHAVVPCVASLVPTALAEERWIMRSMIEHCVGGRRVSYAKGETVISEGEKTGKLFVLLEGGLQVVKNDTVVAALDEPGATVGEMSVLLDGPHSASVVATEPSGIYVFDDAALLLKSHPALALLLARMLAARLAAATTYLADIKKQYAGYGNHLDMVGDVLQSLVSLPARDVSPGSDRQVDPRL